MLPLHADADFTFRFADDRRIPRFHLEDIAAGHRVTVFALDPATGNRLGVLAKATTGEGGWVDLSEPLVVQAGGGFVAVLAPAVVVRPETPADLDAIRRVNTAAFGQDGEARLVDALRDGGFARVSLVAECGGRVVGHVLFGDLAIVTDTGTIPALALAPMAVVPESQNLGVGSELVRRGMETCRAAGHRVVVVLGHPHFYRRFGFTAESARPLESPYAGEAFLAAELVPGALAGVAGRVEYPPPFAAL